MNMDTKISEEINQSKKYLLELVDENIKIPKLTIDNVAKVEAMIQTDSRYSNNSNEYRGNTSAKFFNNLKEIEKNMSEENLDKNKYKIASIIFKLVSAIDRENSTHLNSNLKNSNKKEGGCFKIANAILKIDKKILLDHLQNPEASLSQPEGLFRKIEAKETGGRINTSFASKFCHYACFNLFNDKNRDNYSIYDAVIRRALPVYIKYYKNNEQLSEILKKIEKKKFNLEKYKMLYLDYADFQKVIDAVIKASGNVISRNGFDHLLWYYFKGKNEDEIKEIYNSINC